MRSREKNLAPDGNLWQRRHQAPGVGMNGRGKDLFGRAALDNLALVQDGNALANSRNRWQIVRDVEDRHADLAIQAREKLQDFGLVITSRALVASSAIKSAGRCMMATAMSTRCAWPTLS